MFQKIVAALYIGFIAGMAIEDIGKVYPAVTFTGWSAFTVIGFILVVFLLGYWAKD